MKTEKKQSEATGGRARLDGKFQTILFYGCVSLLAIVPLAFTTAVYRAFTLPKFVVLLVGSTAILLTLSLIAAIKSFPSAFAALKSKLVALVALYIIAIAVATAFGVARLASFFGSYPNEMGLITRFCFFICFIGLIVAVGYSAKRFIVTAWAMAFVGLLVAAYAFAQFFGSDPFLPQAAYTFNSPEGPVIRVTGTLGHSNYLGNFLLYTTPVAAALAICSRGRARRLALATVALSVAAIVFSGTRGAWAGLAVGAVTFAFFELRPGGDKSERPAHARKHKRLAAAITLAVILISAIVIVSSPALRSVGVRARSFAAEGFTGSGRLLLWRDAARMIAAYALTGCGPEGFSKAFLAYKSRQLAIHAPQINNESSHNSYLDAVISFGLPGAIFYIAMIILAFRLLVRSRRNAADPEMRLVITGLVSALAAVIVHNFFIYDQIPTGLYFFALMALAAIASNLTGRRESSAAEDLNPKQRRLPALLWAARAMIVVSFGLVVAAVWFSISLVQSDVAIKHSFAWAAAKDFNGLVASGNRATSGAEPTGAYNFLFARALAFYADAIPQSEKASETSSANASLSAQRERAIEMASAHAEKSLAHTLTPESSYVLLAYLALAATDAEKLREWAGKAINWDPNYFNARWLMAEALLMEGDRDGAVREARLALELRRTNSGAAAVLARAHGEQEIVSPRIRGFIERARLLTERGNTARAQELLVKAIRFSNGPCPACHRELALVYEQENRYRDAIAEWEAFARESPERAAVEQVSARIESLRQK